MISTVNTSRVIPPVYLTHTWTKCCLVKVLPITNQPWSSFSLFQSNLHSLDWVCMEFSRVWSTSTDVLKWTQSFSILKEKGWNLQKLYSERNWHFKPLKQWLSPFKTEASSHFPSLLHHYSAVLSSIWEIGCFHGFHYHYILFLMCLDEIDHP